MELYMNLNRAMGARDHSKNGASPKSQMSRGNFFKITCFALASIIFYGCATDVALKDNSEDIVFDGRTVIAKVENGNEYNELFKTVKAAIMWGERLEWHVITTSNYSNGGFILTLPQTIDDKYLSTIDKEHYWGNFQLLGGGKLAISNKNVKLTVITDISSYDVHNERIDGLLYLNLHSATSDTWAHFWYVDSDVTINGSYTSDSHGDYNEKWNVSLKKGWNIVYETRRWRDDGHEYEYSTHVEGLKWYCFQDDPRSFVFPAFRKATNIIYEFK